MARLLLTKTLTLSTKALKPILRLSSHPKPPPLTRVDVTDTRRKVKSGELKPIYRFPHIVAVRLFCRAKLYQTWLALAAIPSTAILSYLNITTLDVFYQSTAVGLFATFMLYIVSEITRRSIGSIYVNRDSSVVRIAYLSFWGERIDVDVIADEIVPLADISESTNDVFNKVKCYNLQHYWYISIRFGEIIDKKQFENVFGSLDDVK